jgi:hypothetical protein
LLELEALAILEVDILELECKLVENMFEPVGRMAAVVEENILGVGSKLAVATFAKHLDCTSAVASGVAGYK